MILFFNIFFLWLCAQTFEEQINSHDTTLIDPILCPRSNFQMQSQAYEKLKVNVDIEESHLTSDTGHAEIQESSLDCNTSCLDSYQLVFQFKN